MKDQNASGWVTVRCTDELDLYDDQGDTYSANGGKPRSYTQEHVDFIRCVILSPEREHAVEEMTRLVLGDQYGHSTKLFNPTQFASDVLAAFESMNANFKNKRLWGKKFNILFGFTLAIKQYDTWADDSILNAELGRMSDMLNEMIDEICIMWKKVMKRSSIELEIDDEFTRPGIECFLLKFMESVGRDGMEIQST